MNEDTPKDFPNESGDFEQSTWTKRMAEMLKDPKKVAEFEKAISNFLSSVGHKNPAVRRADQMFRLFRRGKGGELMTPRNVLLVGAALLYFLSPADAVPDLLPFIGFLDDLGVLSMVLSMVIPAILENRQTTPEETEELQQEARCIEAEEAAGEVPQNKAEYGRWLRQLVAKVRDKMP